MATRLTNIVLAIRDQLMSLCNLPASRVAVVCRRNVPNLEGDRDVLLRVRNGTFDQAHTSRHDCRIRRIIDVTLRYRLATDKVGSDLNWLTKESVGFLEFENDVLNALQLFEPDNAEHTAMLMVQPLRALSMTDPTKDSPSADMRTWGEEVFSFELIYAGDLDQTVI